MIRKIVFSAIYVALILALTAIPINILIVSITVNTIVLVIATLHLGFLGAMVASVTWGFAAWLLSLAGLDPSGLFIWPDIAVVPRVLTGFIVYGVYWLVKGHKQHIWKGVVLGVICAFSNTMLVTLFIFIHQGIFGYMKTEVPNLWVWFGWIWINFLTEIIITPIVVTAMFPLITLLKHKHAHAQLNEY